MVEEGRTRRFSRAFKLAALARMAAGENVSALSRELGFRANICISGASASGWGVRWRCAAGVG
jgi:hypothetical protein